MANAQENGNIESYVNDAINKMNIEYLDLLLIHWPIPEYLSQTWQSMQNLSLLVQLKK